MRGTRLTGRAALAVAVLALIAALAGTVYAAGRIDGRSIRVRSLPGNRLKPHSLPADRLRRGVLSGLEQRLSGPVGGARIDERSLAQVPSADYADSAGLAQLAVEAQTAVDAINAVDAATVNGHSAGCLVGTTAFAGACWETASSEAPATAPAAAVACGARGGVLPEALQLAAFAAQPNVKLDPNDEWSSDLTNDSGPNVYGVLTVSREAVIAMALPTNTKHYRCVFPVVG